MFGYQGNLFGYQGNKMFGYWGNFTLKTEQREMFNYRGTSVSICQTKPC